MHSTSWFFSRQKPAALVNELYLAAGKNDLYARQGRASTNDMAKSDKAIISAMIQA